MRPKLQYKWYSRKLKYEVVYAQEGAVTGRVLWRRVTGAGQTHTATVLFCKCTPKPKFHFFVKSGGNYSFTTAVTGSPAPT